jgi:hypothetical protein
MTEWRNIRAAFARIGGYFALMATGYAAYALLNAPCR